MNNMIVSVWLNLKTYYNNFFNNIVSYFGAKEILVHEKGNVYNVIWKYFVYKMIGSIQKDIDIQANQVHLKITTPKGDTKIILDSEHIGEPITFSMIERYINHNQDNNKMVDAVYLNFDLVNPNGNVCLKSLVFEYYDKDKKYAHTLENILKFNNISFDHNSSINIKVLNDDGIVENKFKITECCKKHINNIV